MNDRQSVAYLEGGEGVAALTLVEKKIKISQEKSIFLKNLSGEI